MVVRRRPTLPPRHQGSTIGAVRLSFRVRNGTGRFPHAMTTVTLSRTGNPHIHTPTDKTSSGGGWGLVPVTREPHSGRVAQSNFGITHDVGDEVIGRLVPVSSTGLQSLLPHPAYQPSGLLGASHTQGVWKPHLEAGFPLRCFQRLSLPNVANQPCSWRNNWHTRGSSVPVLSD